LAVFRITKIRDPLLVVMLGMHVVEELSLVQLNNIENFLSLFEKFASLKVLISTH